MVQSERADFYAALAEVLAEPSDWMTLPGRKWPLFDLASRLLPNSPGLVGLSLIPDEELLSLRQRYAALFGGASGQPRIWLYESAYLSGRILGEATFAVAKFYAEARVQVNGSELPDHASLELAFLAHLVETGNTAVEQCFLREHAGRWLPDLGRTLVRAGDPIYATIGQLLTDWLGRPLKARLGKKTSRLPALLDEDACTLCGFCAQRCPTRAINVLEDEHETQLVLTAEACTGCERCARACEASLLAMRPIEMEAGQSPRVMRRSERVVCSQCGRPTVSRAEFDFVVKQIGHPAWLDYCPQCRMPAQIGA